MIWLQLSPSTVHNWACFHDFRFTVTIFNLLTLFPHSSQFSYFLIPISIPFSFPSHTFLPISRLLFSSSQFQHLFMNLSHSLFMRSFIPLFNYSVFNLLSLLILPNFKFTFREYKIFYLSWALIYFFLFSFIFLVWRGASKTLSYYLNAFLII